MSGFGPACAEAADGARLRTVPAGTELRTQREVIRELMLAAGARGAWLTLREIASLTGYGEASISAQLRHLRKPAFGDYAVEKRRRGPDAESQRGSVPCGTGRGEPRAGLWEYRLLPRGDIGIEPARQMDLRSEVRRPIADVRAPSK